MKNKSILFSTNGYFVKEISSDQIKCKNGNVSLGENGVINFQNHVTFIKKNDVAIDIENKLDYLEVYVFDTLVFKGFGYYGETRHSSLYIIAKIEGDIFKIYFSGNADENISVLKNCNNTGN